jgi:HNH endonuclease
MTTEEYREVTGFPGYTVSNRGRVKNPRGWVLKFDYTGPGYARVTLSKQAKTFRFSVHRLVALAFVPGDTSLQVNHIDGDRTNNYPENLEWLSGYDNRRHAFLAGRAKGEMLPYEDALKLRVELYTTLLCDRAIGLQFGATKAQVRDARKYYKIPRVLPRGLYA